MPSEARACAYAVLRRTFEQGAYSDQALHAAAGALEMRDRALATRLVFGAVQRRGTLDHLIEVLAGRRIERLDASVVAALRLGLYELLWSAAAPHAVVDEAVELAKRAGRGAGLVNAVLRRATRESPLAGLDDATPATAALMHSVPEWIVRAWWEALGAEGTRALLHAANSPAESALRANTLVGDAAALVARLPVAAHRAEAPAEAVLLDEPFDAHGSPLWEEGAFMPQSRAAMLVAHVLDPRPDERILDLCAAPGAKTTHAGALMRAQGELVAVERHAGRARALERTCARMGVDAAVRVEVADATSRPRSVQFDRVLLDAPCSGLGTLNSRPDLRWRASPERVAALAAEQARLLSAAAATLRPGGVLVYSTCTISPPENEQQIDRFLDGQPDFDAENLQAQFPAWSHPARPRELLALPSVQGSDGFFIARLRRR